MRLHETRELALHPSPEISPAGQRLAGKSMDRRKDLTFFAIGRTITHCLRHCPIPVLAVSRPLWLGLHSSGSYGCSFRSSPAPGRLRIPPAPRMLVRFPGLCGRRDPPRAVCSPTRISGRASPRHWQPVGGFAPTGARSSVPSRFQPAPRDRRRSALTEKRHCSHRRAQNSSPPGVAPPRATPPTPVSTC